MTLNVKTTITLTLTPSCGFNPRPTRPLLHFDNDDDDGRLTAAQALQDPWIQTIHHLKPSFPHFVPKQGGCGGSGSGTSGGGGGSSAGSGTSGGSGTNGSGGGK